GRPVAVKVQYPGVDEAIKADLQNADMLFQTVAAMFGGFDPRALLEEVVARMTEEFDYRREAANQQHFADEYRDHPYVKIPDELERSLRELTVIPQGAVVDRNRLWEFFTMMLRPIVDDAPFRYTRKMVGDTFRGVALPDSPYRDIQEMLEFPAMLMMWQRYT